ncbi:hypothetical protein [Streptomyces sp. NPDC058086]|uniref:hypothetical protein n=1 Tax=Streptomyces sp. NPDC058086 TaxID=3346334 RepID=UPI0036E34C81
MHTSSFSLPPQAPGRPTHRLAWLDNLRIALTVLVVLHHAAQACGPADWWYVEGQPRASRAVRVRRSVLLDFSPS